jgi:hypothetical protein
MLQPVFVNANIPQRLIKFKIKFIMHNISNLFKQAKQPSEVDDLYHIFNQSNGLNMVYWDFFFRLVENLSFNAIVECGVGRGRSLISLLMLENYYATLGGRCKRKIYGLDSFDGFPEPTKFDISKRNPAKGEWAYSPSGKYKYSPSFIKEIISRADLSTELVNLEIIQGFFDESVPKLPEEPIGILHLDGDLYDSVMTPLNLLSNRVILGGVIVIDDYIVLNDPKLDPFPGARAAVEEFLLKNKNFSLHISVRGNPYITKNEL